MLEKMNKHNNNNEDWIEVKRKGMKSENPLLFHVYKDKEYDKSTGQKQMKRTPMRYNNYPQHNNHPHKEGDIIYAVVPGTISVWRPSIILGVDEENNEYLVRTETLVPITDYVKYGDTKYVKIPKLTVEEEKCFNDKGYVAKNDCPMKGFRRAIPNDFKITEQEFIYLKQFTKKSNIGCLEPYGNIICECCSAKNISNILSRNVYRCGNCACCCGGMDFAMDHTTNIRNEYKIVNKNKRQIITVTDKQGFAYQNNDYTKAYFPV